MVEEAQLVTILGVEHCHGGREDVFGLCLAQLGKGWWAPEGESEPWLKFC